MAVAVKIAFVSNIFAPHIRGGYELGCQDIALEFQALGHQVSVLTSRTHGQLDHGAPHPALPIHEIFEPVFAFENAMGDLLDESPGWHRQRTDALGGCMIGNAIALHSHLQRERPDLTWVFNPIGLGPVSLLETLLLSPGKVLLHLMDDLDHYLGQSRRQLDWTPRLRRIKRGLTAVSCSEITRRANERFGTFGRHAVIPNGIDFATWSTPTPAARPADDTPLRLVYFGQVEEPKGLIPLVQALAYLDRSDQAHPFVLDLIGNGSPSFLERLRHTASELGIADRVRLVGFCNRQDLPARLAHYDAAIMLLRRGEPFGYAPLEAIAAGLPVILTRHTGCAECMPPDYQFFVDDRDNVEEVARVIRHLAQLRHSLPDIARDLRQQMHARCDLRHSVIPRYESLIASLPANPATGSIDALLSAIRTYDSYEMYSSTM